MRKLATKQGRGHPRVAAFEPKAKTTISVARSLLAYADTLAANKRVTRSKVIEGLLAEAHRREEEELMVEGYRFFNKENVNFAEESAGAVWEAIEDAG